MFEKEAEEMAEVWLNERYLKDMGVRKPCKKAYETGFQDGYNKAFVEADKNLKAIVTDFNKAKEIIKEMLSILPKENIEGVYEITEEAEEFLKEVEE